MKLYELKEGQTIEVGDYIVFYTPYSKNFYPVVRVTKNFVFVRLHLHSEGKFSRIYSKYSFKPYPKARWDTNRYIAKRIIDE